jgi:hypothetical protein
VHPMAGPAVDTTNGAGPRNVQLFVLAPDGTVLHCLPGFWNPEDLSSELDLSERLLRIWSDSSVPADQKGKLFATEHMRHLEGHSTATRDRSHLQGFDMVHIYNNRKGALADAVKDQTALVSCDSHHLPYEAFKTTDVILHERMSKRPFISYASFDVGDFVNYGTNHYDKDEHKIDPGSVAALKTHDLRDLLTETWQEKPTVATRGSDGRPITWRNMATLDQTLVAGFWKCIENHNWEKADKVANYLITRRPNEPNGYQMKAVMFYEKRQYTEACREAWKAIQRGGRHPKLLALYKDCCKIAKSRTVSSRL